MTPLQLTLKGFIGIQAGLGSGILNIDLEQYTGLIALVGPNGKGKTTLIDNLHPYRLMPSKIDVRQSGYSTRAFSYYDHVDGDGVKALLWEHDGRRYLSMLVFKQTGKTRKTEAFLSIQGLQGGWEPYALPDGTSADGKTEVYDRCVEHILGSADSFFTSVFACQGRTKLSDYKNADIKAMLADMLGMQNIQDLAARAGLVRRGLAQQLAAARSRIGDRAALEAALTAADIQLTRDAEASQRSANELDTTLAHLEDKTTALAEARANVERAKHIEDQRADINRQRAAVEQRRMDRFSDLKATYDSAMEQAEASLDDLLKRRSEILGVISQTKASIEADEVTAGRAPAVDAAAADVGRLEEDQINAIEANKRITEISTRNTAIETTIREAQAALDSLKERGTYLRRNLEREENTHKLVEEVPCAGMDKLTATCPLLEQARAGGAKADSLRPELEELRAQYQSQHEAHCEYVEQNPLTPGIANAPDLDAINRELEHARNLAADAPLVNAAVARIVVNREALERSEKDASELHDRIRAIDAANVEREKAFIAQKDIINLAASEEDQALIARLNDLPDISADVPASEQAVQEQQLRVDTARALLEESSKTRARSEAARDAAGVALDRHEEAAAQLETAENTLGKWVILERALGNDGIIALCIDDAGPTIAGICNDLLRQCYGARFTVGLETQAMTQQGKVKEVFDVAVFDAEADQKQSLRDCSGGQALWINEAVTRSIALFLAQQTGNRYRTLFSDESDGALDPEKKMEFYRMKRAVLKSGGYDREYFITHTPELLDQADHLIDMESLVA